MLGVRFDIVVTNADETLNEAWKPSEAVERLATLKAEVASRSSIADAAVILAADTVVVIDDDILGKPRDVADAKAMLGRLSGRQHDVYTGLAVWTAKDLKIQSAHVRTTVTMRDRDAEWIDWYVSTGEPTDKAGAYAIQGLGSMMVERINGDYWNVVGLPVGGVENLLGRRGLSLRMWM